MADAKSPRQRPLSPHLQIYRPMLTMMMSIFHRITGSALYVGTLLFAWWLIAAAMGPEAYATAGAFFDSLIGRLVLFFYTWALLHHMAGRSAALGLGHDSRLRDSHRRNSPRARPSSAPSASPFWSG